MHRLPERWRATFRQHDSFALRIGLALGAVTLLFVLIGGSIAYWNALRIAQGKESEWLDDEIVQESRRAAETINLFNQIVADIAAADLVASTIVDTVGREQHLGPFLRLLEKTLSRQFGGDRQNIANVSIRDYRGALYGTTGAPTAVQVEGAPWLAKVMANQAHAMYLADAEMLLVAHPIIFPGTQQPEGLVVGTLSLKNLGQAIAGTRWLSALGTETSVTRVSLAPDVQARVQTVPLATPLADLKLVLALGYPLDRSTGEARSILYPYLLTFLASILVVIGAGLRLGRWISAPLSRLASISSQLPEQGNVALSTDPLVAAAAPEVRALADTIEKAFARIEDNVAEMRLVRSALESARDSLVIADAQQPGWPLIYVNAAFERITGYSRREVLGKSGRMLHRDDGDQEGLAELLRALKAGEACKVLLRNYRQDGSMWWNELSVAPVRDPAGQVTHYVGFQDDVTERLRSEDRLRDVQKLEALGQLTGGLAHDFNNLLGIVIGNLDMVLEQANLEPALAKRITTALAAAERGGEVTRSLLAIARRQRLEPAVADVNERLRALRPLIANTVSSRIEVEEALCDGAALAHLDLNGFDSAVLNLVINARDAMVATGGRLVLSTRKVHVAADDVSYAASGVTPGDYIAIGVSDNGSGMSPEVLSHAFEPFFTTKQRGHGTGLGLPMVYGFAKQSGGIATIYSELGQGTTVRLYLPAAEHETPAETVADQALAAGHPGTGRRCLLVEDQSAAADITAAWLHEFGYGVTVVGNADQARARLEDERFDLLLTDVIMPGSMDGLALAQWALAHAPDMHVLVASGFSERLLGDELPWRILEKPFRKADLARALKAIGEAEPSS